LAAILAGDAVPIIAGVVADGAAAVVAAPLSGRFIEINPRLDFHLVTGPIWSRLLVAQSPMSEEETQNLVRLWAQRRYS